ncbi:hypothetical protein TCEA9_22470 [Thermobrachium celere]|uniref:DUF7916 family protein n=1 Tax=Thermobrachium celere TaxID=53422 RepID=UPI001A4DD104|nr:hypothetical protein [Thermobrachium celere]GFR36435.1 hypothetical protein TCEA9_22470 [Thermobrachium celere]
MTIVSEGRRVNVKTDRKAIKLGVDMIVITANPNTGVSNDNIIQAIKDIKKKFRMKLLFQQVRCTQLQI